ncbi:MAG: selenocysteine-specific translation elongation factor [Nitrospirae bacterium]|nr:selenocysteine-specific translation elongation factor [Nitrospirota bacterium]
MNRYVILGTAGHIDHGKSALVKALTGTDPDRLKEEKARGITIDLGFADLSYPDGLRVGIIDVPGHERLVKNMLAGASGIDIVLMVIAADEGIMPQSREHLAICNLLKVKKGIIAITKSDLVDKEWLSLVIEEVKEFAKGTFLKGAEIIAVSSKTGENLDLLKEKIKEAASGVEPKHEKAVFRLPVDRVFTLKGFGTVVTGTSISGSIKTDAPVEILPKGIAAKVRGLQSHGEAIEAAYAGQRVAVNLLGVSKDEIQRGDVLATPGKLKSSHVVDAEIELLKDSPLNSLKNRSLVHFHAGSSEITGRIIIYGKDELKPGEDALCQFRFPKPVALMAGDRYIIRRFSPLMTIGGGEVIDPSPRRRKKGQDIEGQSVFVEGSLSEKIAAKIRQKGLQGLSRGELEGWIMAELADINSALDKLISRGEIMKCEERLIHKDAFNDFSGGIISMLRDFHAKNPLKPGMPKEEIRSSFQAIDQRHFDGLLAKVKDIVFDKEVIKLSAFRLSLSEGNKETREKILKALDASEFQPPTDEELAALARVDKKEVAEILKIMAKEGEIVRIKDSIYISKPNHSKMIERLKGFYSKKAEMTVGEFRDILNTSRKYALPFLEYLDGSRITMRVGDVRKFLYKGQ